MNVAWKIRGFAGTRYGIPFGTLLLETTHRSEASAFVEIEAWRQQMRRGEVSRVELIDMRSGKVHNLTNLNVYAHTHIPWSHLSSSET